MNDIEITPQILRFHPFGSGTEEEREFVRSAWAVVIQHQDLLDWAVCAVTGNPRAGGCVMRKFRGESRVRVLLTGLLQNGTVGMGLSAGIVAGGAAAVGNIIAPGVGVPIALAVAVVGALAVGDLMLLNRRCGQGFERMMLLWRQGGIYSDCARVALAALLVHEMVHICNREIFFAEDWPLTDDRWEDQRFGCSYAYRIESLFRWGVQQRTPGLHTPWDATVDDFVGQIPGMSCCGDALLWACDDGGLQPFPSELLGLPGSAGCPLRDFDPEFDAARCAGVD